MSNPKNLEQYLREPYARILTPDPETNTYTAQIMEFPGCVAQGDSPEEAYANLERTAGGWIQAALDMGQLIPEPAANQTFGGKILLRLSRSLHRQVADLADREGVSLNQFIVTALAEKAGAVNTSYQALQLVRNHYQSSARMMGGLQFPRTYPSGSDTLQSVINLDLGSSVASTGDEVKH